MKSQFGLLLIVLSIFFNSIDASPLQQVGINSARQDEDGDEATAVAATANPAETLAGVGSLVSQILGGVGTLGNALYKRPAAAAPAATNQQPQQILVAAPAVQSAASGQQLIAIPQQQAVAAVPVATAAQKTEEEDDDDDISRL